MTSVLSSGATQLNSEEYITLTNMHAGVFFIGWFVCFFVYCYGSFLVWLLLLLLGFFYMFVFFPGQKNICVKERISLPLPLTHKFARLCPSQTQAASLA